MALKENDGYILMPDNKMETRQELGLKTIGPAGLLRKDDPKNTR